MGKFLPFGALRTPDGRPRRTLFLISFVLLAALLFTFGEEVYGHHSHSGPAPDQNCVACRHLITPAKPTPSEAALGTLLFEDSGSRPSVMPTDVPPGHTPAPTSLRGPPQA